MTEQKKKDWNSIWSAAAVILSLGSLIIGCYVSMRTDLTVIKTVLIMKGIMPDSLADRGEK